MSLAPAADIQQNSSAPPSLSEKTSTSGSTPTLNEKQTEGDHKIKKRSLFGFGKKKTETEEKMSAAPTGARTPSKAEASLPSPPHTQDASQLSSRRSTQTSPAPMDAPHRIPSSPGRGIYSSSPHLASPAGSQIFERDVQESAIMPNSPAIPSHIQVENHIPPALDATSEAITDDHLNPDSVEIVTHASHQPASVNVTGASPFETQSSASWVDELQSLAEKEEAASNYGNLDSADVRRLSFISFADVVQAEQGAHGAAASSRDSIYLAGLTSLSSSGVGRSPSPIRSPISSQGPESPPRSKSGSVKGSDASPSRKPLGSPTSTQHNLGAAISGDLNIETMSQALRRTGSADLSVHRSLPVSPIEGSLPR